MKWMSGLLLALPAGAAAPAAAQDLVAQRVIGAVRHCAYSNPSVTGRRRAPLVERQIGRGEPCPRRYQRPEATAPDGTPPEDASVPSMATLVAQEVSQGQRICLYEYVGQRYRRAVPLTSFCPYTPLLPR